MRLASHWCPKCTRFQLRRAQERLHVLEGLLVALDHLDEVIALIRNAESADVARGQLMERYSCRRLRVRDLWHLEHRLVRKILSHTVATWLKLSST